MKPSALALVTGANRGIGQAVAAGLTARGFDVVPTSRKPGAGQSLLDVTSPESVEGLGREIARRGGLDALINNAGVSLDGFDAKIAQSTLDTNLHGALRVTDACLPHLRPGARVVMMSSGMGALSALSPELRRRFEDPSLDRAALLDLVASFVADVDAGRHAARGWPTNCYRVSKIALNALTRVLARELAGDARGIVVNAVDPGWVRTRMGGSSAPRSPEEGARTAVWLAQLPAGGPTGGIFRDEKAIGF